MLKKMIPFIFVSALLLGACSTNTKDTVPNNDRTPLEDVEQRERDSAPGTEDNRRDGTDLEGVETEGERNGGVINDEMNDRLDDGNDPLLDDDRNVNEDVSR